MFVTKSSDFIEHDIEAVAKLIDECDFIVFNIFPYCKQIIVLIEKSRKPIW